MAQLASGFPTALPHRNGITSAIRGLGHRATAAQLADLHRLVSDHIRLTESGLYHEVLETSPRLERHVRLLVRDHVVLAEAVAYLGHRGRTGDLKRLWRRHRQRGADLLHAAYAVDIGGET
jgi:hypothetical protein